MNRKAQEDISDFHSFYVIVILYSFLPLRHHLMYSQSISDHTIEQMSNALFLSIS